MKIEPFKSLSKNGEALFKDRGSKHFGFAFGIDSLEKAKQKISEIRAEHNTANHHCFAYIIESDILIKRSSDDGEPNNSSGPPILKQIEKYDLTNVLVVVVRYFGGTKLGVGGLVSAYKECAKLTIESNTIITKDITITIQIKFDYLLMNKVMRVIKENNLKILNQQMDTSCVFELLTTKQNNDIVCDQFNRHLGIVISIK